MAQRKRKKFNFQTANRQIAKLVSGRLGPAKAMERLINHFQITHPHPSWEKFLEVDFESDLDRSCRWAETVLTRKPPDDCINLIWFGINNPVLRGNTTADVYLTGAASFFSDQDVDEWDWKKRYWPKGRYARSKAMNTIYRIAYQKNGHNRAKNKLQSSGSRHHCCNEVTCHISRKKCAWRFPTHSNQNQGRTWAIRGH